MVFDKCICFDNVLNMAGDMVQFRHLKGRVGLYEKLNKWGVLFVAKNEAKLPKIEIQTW